MAYKLLYIEDQKADSRELDLKALGFEVESYDPSSDLSEILPKVNDQISALVMDYRLTKGDNQACFDAPTIAATLRSKHSDDFKERPIILMSNEDIIIYYYKDFTNQDLFDYALSKKDFLENKEKFKKSLISFITAYSKIKSDNFDLLKIFDLKNQDDRVLIHPQISLKLKLRKGFVYEHSRLIYDTLIHSIGSLIGEDVLSARLGICRTSKDWTKIIIELKETQYTGIFADSHDRWWSEKINFWWINKVKSKDPLRRLNAEERLAIIKENLKLENLIPAQKTEYSQSTNFWTICKHSSKPIDPFDGIELLKKNYLPWQDKEYLSFESAIMNMDTYKDYISEIDKKAIRELAQKVNNHG